MSKKNRGPKPGSRRQEKLAARAAERAEFDVDPRTFRGLAAECDLVAMREFVPSATLTLSARDAAGAAVPVTVATVLPGAVAALRREETAGAARLVGVQTAVRTVRPSRDLGAAVAWALEAAPGASLQSAAGPEPRPELREVVDPGAAYEVTVHEDFAWWGLDGDHQAVRAAEEAMMPSARIEAPGVRAAWWVDAGEKAHIRWIRPEDEDVLFTALARLQAAGELTLGEGSRFAGSFRTHGLLVPVFDVDPEAHPREWADGCVALGARIDEVLGDDAPLTPGQRRARDALRSRQVTLQV